jgi:hypothetical protein
VFLYYCSSDSWGGRRSDVVLTNPANATDRYRLHFRGHDIADPAMAELVRTGDKLMITSGALYDEFHDQSCLERHPGEDRWMCADTAHIRLNHITTPYFQRMDLTDPLYVNNFPGTTARTVGRWIQATARRIPNVRTQAEEAAAITRTPAIYAPLCGQHVGITNNAYFSVVTLLDPGGTPRTCHDALLAWLGGADVAFIDDGTPPPASVCPPTTASDN